MTKNELIAKQQIELEEYKKRFTETRKLLKQANNKFYGIGAPLNDNILQFNKEQLKWCWSLLKIIDKIY